MRQRSRDDRSGSPLSSQNLETRASVERWLANHRGAMLSVARRFAGRATSAEDIVQEASMVAMSLLAKAPSVSSPRKWLSAITRNVGLHVWRKRKGTARHHNAFLMDRPDDWFGEDPVANWHEAESLGARESRPRAFSWTDRDCPSPWL